MQLSKFNKILVIFIVIMTFAISIGYSALNASLSISGDLVYRVPADIRITGVKLSSVTNGGLEQYTPKYTKDTVSLGLKLPNLNSTVVYEVTVTNKSSKAKLISEITNQIQGNTNIVYSCNYSLNTTILGNSTMKILFTYKYNSGITTLPSNTIKENTIKLTFKDAQVLYQRIKTDFNDSTKYIKKYDGDTSTFSGNQDIYYYYGAASSNNVLFANYCWKIIRTTSTGGVKLLYNGVPDASRACNNTNDDATLTKEQMNTSLEEIRFNSDIFSLADIGYMYNTRYERQSRNLSSYMNFTYGRGFSWDGNKYTLTNAMVVPYQEIQKIAGLHYTCLGNNTCDEIKYIYYFNFRINSNSTTGTPQITSASLDYITIANGKSVEDAINEMLYNDDVNKNNSNIKNAIDYWYQQNMTSYTKYLEDTIWCNDRSTSNLSASGWNPNGGSISNKLYFKSYNDKTNLTCKNKNDRFTVNKANGNGALTYPVGLMDATEAQLSYTSSSPYSPHALEKDYWLLSPNNYYMDVGSVEIATKESVKTSILQYSYAVRPAISLKEGMPYSTGDGSSNKPYIILSLPDTFE